MRGRGAICAAVLALFACSKHDARTRASHADVHVEASSGGAVSSAVEPCRWPGWFRAPQLPSGCNGLCVPDDVAQRVPSLAWVERSDWCSGCRTLSTPWATADADRSDPVGSGISGEGPLPDYVSIAVGRHDDWIGTVFDRDGHPVVGWRTDYDAAAG